MMILDQHQHHAVYQSNIAGQRAQPEEYEEENYADDPFVVDEGATDS